MEVILRWAAPVCRFGLVQMDDVADNDLGDVEDEKRESELLSHGLDTHTGNRVAGFCDIPCGCCRNGLRHQW